METMGYILGLYDVILHVLSTCFSHSGHIPDPTKSRVQFYVPWSSLTFHGVGNIPK